VNRSVRLQLAATALCAGVGLALCLGLGGCSLNPQPLPPGTGEPTDGVGGADFPSGYDAATASLGEGDAGDAGRRTDAGHGPVRDGSAAAKSDGAASDARSPEAGDGASDTGGDAS